MQLNYTGTTSVEMIVFPSPKSFTELRYTNKNIIHLLSISTTVSSKVHSINGTKSIGAN